VEVVRSGEARGCRCHGALLRWCWRELAGSGGAGSSCVGLACGAVFDWSALSRGFGRGRSRCAGFTFPGFDVCGRRVAAVGVVRAVAVMRFSVVL